MFAKRMSSIDSSGIRKVFDLALQMEDPVNFSIGAPDFDVPEEIKEDAIKALRDGFNRYTPTQGISPLRQRVAEKLKEENDIQVTEDAVLITCGVSGGLFLAFNVLLDIGDEAIVFDPYFTMYKHLINFIGAVPKYVNTFPDFHLDIDRLKSAITNKTRLIVLNSPGNPTGMVYSKSEIEDVVNLADKWGLFVISDEVYESFIYEEPCFSIGSIYAQTLTLNGFSKSHSMTGWRIGYAAGPLDVIAEMAKLQQYSFVCAPSFAQIAATKALDYDMTKYVSEYKIKRDLIYEGLKDCFEIYKPKGGFYIFPRVIGIKGTEFVNKAIANNVLIIPGNIFSEQDTHFRASFATSNEKIEQGIRILRELVKSEHLLPTQQ